ncbi:MAG TPA: hypothetical protein PK986_01330, partial [Spirochaetota bacterium]|nr:hypothetical protein [Spirochaetota bacterium]
IKFIISSAVVSVFCVSVNAAGDELVMDKPFFKSFSRINSVVRDEFIEKQMNRIVIGRGTIISISEQERYKKKYRIVVESSDAGDFGYKFRFYIYTDNRDTLDLLTLDSSFEFKGQLAGYTPLDTKRTRYILDVIFMDGSTIIE